MQQVTASACLEAVALPTSSMFPRLETVLPGRVAALDLITGAGLMDGVQIVRRPFSVEELVAAVQEALGSASVKDKHSPE